MVNKKTIKIGVNVSFLRKRGSGTEQVTRGFLRKLIDFSQDVTLIKDPVLREKFLRVEFCLYAEEDFDLELPGNFYKKVFLPAFYWRDDLIRKVIWEKLLLPSRVRQDGCQVFFSLYQSPTILGGTPHLMLVHDVVWKLFPNYLNNSRKKTYQWLVDRAISRASQLLTVSRYSRQLIARHFNFSKEQIKVAYIDCDPLFKKVSASEETDRRVLSSYNLASGQSYIFYIGGFDVRKNAAGLIEAYGKLVASLVSQGWKEGEVPGLILAGKFHSHLVPLVTDVPVIIKEVSARYGFSRSKIKLPGFVPTEEVVSFFRQALFACYPSFYEGFGIPPLEAMACGCPVITSHTSSLPEVVEESALLVDPENSQDVAQAMEKLTQSATMRADLKEKGLEQAKKFSWESFTEKALKEIFDLVDHQHS